jgi:hypothetical protein
VKLKCSNGADTLAARFLLILLFGWVTPLGVFAAGNNWMGSLNPNALLSQLSIPGTHDAGALFDPPGYPGTTKCQNLSIADQLNTGVRFLDVRCNNSGGTFLIYHGIIYQNLNFDDVLNAVFGFLTNNPTECVIMSVKEENSSTGGAFETAFDTYVAKNPGGWLLGSGIPTLTQARGKIVLFRRFTASSLPKGIPAASWPDNTTFTSGVLRVQDAYQVTSNDMKWTAITNLFNETNNTGTGTLYVNFASGVSNSPVTGLPNIPIVANDINARLTNYLATSFTGKRGILLLDFADINLCQLIYTNNFFVSGVALPKMSVRTSNANVIVAWTPMGGTLQSSEAVTGPFTNVPAATSPYTNVRSAPQLFFRVSL